MASPVVEWVKLNFEVAITTLLDGKVEIKMTVPLLDGKVRVGKAGVPLLDGVAHVVYSSTLKFDGKVVVEYQPWQSYRGLKRIVLLDLGYGEEGKYKYFGTDHWVDEELGIQYMPSLVNVSSISHSVEAIEGGSQVANCTCSIQNASGKIVGDVDDPVEADRDYINTFKFREKYKIKNRLARVWIVYDGYPSTKQLIFEGKVQDDDIDNQEWRITIQDSFAKFDTTLPKRLYNTEDYPNLEEGTAGQAIPYGFGEITKAPAIAIDTVTHRYKVSDLEVKSFDDIYVTYGNSEDKQRYVFKVRYTGSKAQCLWNKSRNNRLVIITANADNTDATVDIDYDLTNVSYDTIDEVVSALNGETDYDCELIIESTEASTISSTDIREAYDVDIHTNYVQIETGGKVDWSIKDACDITTYKDDGEFTIDLSCFVLEYTGSGTKALLNISDSGRLVIVCAGASGDNVDIDMTVSDYNTMKKVSDYLNGLSNFTTTSLASAMEDVPSALLKKVLDVDVKVSGGKPVDMRAPAKGQILVDFQGVPDNGDGDYTGTASALIERPPDIVHYILKEILGATTTDVHESSFELARQQTWKGFKFRRYLKDLDSSFNVMSDIAQEAYAWIYVDKEGEVRWVNKKGDIFEDVDNRYYEFGQYPRIQEGTFSKSSTLRNLWNKISVNYDYQHSEGAFRRTGNFENAYSQDETKGYGTTNHFKQDCYWVPDDVPVATISYTGDATKLTITGSEDDMLSYFRAEQGATLDIDISLEDTLYNTLAKLKAYVEAQGNYTLTILDSNFDSLESYGLQDVVLNDITSGSGATLYFSYAKLFGVKYKRRYSILMDRVGFGTNLFGLHQELAKPIMVQGFKEDEPRRYRLLSVDTDVDNFTSHLVADYEPRCECFNMCYGYHDCVCDGSCYGYASCTCDQTTYAPPACQCDGECYLYVACSCDNTCYVEGTGCSCDNTCYGYRSCTCDRTCYLDNCTCDYTTYTAECSCHSTCYGYLPCTCDLVCYGDNCLCDGTCYLEKCVCDNACYDYYCVCNYTCYIEGLLGFCWRGYRECYLQTCPVCYNRCYAEDNDCICDNTCYGDTGCSCDGTCYGYVACLTYAGLCLGYTAGCTCDSRCYEDTCSCDNTCYGYRGCTCNYRSYGGVGCTCDTLCYDEGSCSCEGSFSPTGGCYCENTCYGDTPCVCDSQCHVEEVGCNCDYTVYEYQD
jgi:hypothetical protein